MESQLKELVQGFDKDPRAAGRAMRELAESDRPSFTKSGLEIMKTAAEGAGSNYLLALLVQDVSLSSKLCDAAALSLDEAAQVARRIQKLNPQFDVGMARQINDAFSGKCPLDPKMAERLLELIASFSDPGRVLPLLAQLLRHPNPRIRSKTVLLIGRGSANAKLAESYMREPDQRVRANAIEALWGNTAEEARAILRQSVSDSDNRVAANALMGLYKLGDTSSIGLLRQMAEAESAPRRASAVWAMKESADPRFVRTLAGLISDPDAKVRQNALQALAHIRKNKARLQAGEALRIVVTEAEASMDGHRKLRLSVCSKSGNPVAGLGPLQVLLEEDKRSITDYSVQEVFAPETVALGIAIPRILETDDEFRSACEASIRHCLELKRKLDVWAILRYATEPPVTPSPTAAVKFNCDAAAVSEYLTASVHRDEAADSLKDAAMRLLEEMSQKKLRRQILLIDGPAASLRSLKEADANELLIQAKSGKIQVHSLVRASSDSDVSPHLLELCRESGGKVICIASLEEMTGALEALYCSLLNRYEITYASESTQSPVQVLLQILSPSGCGEQKCEIVPAPSQEGEPEPVPENAPAPAAT